MLLVLQGKPRSTQPWSHLQLQRNGHKLNVLTRRKCVILGWVWEPRSSSHVTLCFGNRPDRLPTRSSKHNIMRAPICRSATGAVRQDDVDGQCPQILMTSKWCPASNVSQAATRPRPSTMLMQRSTVLPIPAAAIGPRRAAKRVPLVLLVLRGKPRSTQSLSHLQLQRNGHKLNVLTSRKCVISGGMWESRSSSHVIQDGGCKGREEGGRKG